MNIIINDLESIQKKFITNFNIGDIICVNFNIIDKRYKNRKQNFEGLVIAKHNNGLSSTFKVRKISYGEGVEKTFPLHSPIINSITIKKTGFVKKAKLYYIRKLTGKAARIKERKHYK